MRSRRITYYSAAIALAILLTVSTAAHAQGFGAAIGGGGGGGLIQPFITWVVNNILQGLIEGGILFVGALLIFSRHNLAGIAVVIIGAIVMSQYQNLAALVPIGGG